MTTSKYTDRRGLGIHPSRIAEMFEDSGLNRRAFDSACEGLSLEPWQRTAFLDIYGSAVQALGKTNANF